MLYTLQAIRYYLAFWLFLADQTEHNDGDGGDDKKQTAVVGVVHAVEDGGSILRFTARRGGVREVQGHPDDTAHVTYDNSPERTLLKKENTFIGENNAIGLCSKLRATRRPFWWWQCHGVGRSPSWW